MRLVKLLCASAACVVVLILALCGAVSAKPFLQVAGEIRLAQSSSDFPPLLIQAVLVAEDPDFLERSRFDSLGRTLRGPGSSLTAHLIRIVLNDEQRYRALRESLVYVEIELTQPRQRILSTYLDNVYLAQGSIGAVHGVRAGAMHYWGKSVETLSIAECALLAALIKGPGYYSPAERPERALERRNFVLLRLTQNGVITDAQFQEAAGSGLQMKTDAGS